MSRFIVSVVLPALILAGGMTVAYTRWARAAEPQAPAKPPFVLNLTSDSSDLHRTTMALALARHALDDGRKVVIFLNVKAPEVARKDAPQKALGDNPPPATLLAELMGRGAEVHVCPMCMKALSIGPDQLIPGVVVTDRGKLFSRITAGAVVFSY